MLKLLVGTGPTEEGGYIGVVVEEGPPQWSPTVLILFLFVKVMTLSALFFSLGLTLGIIIVFVQNSVKHLVHGRITVVPNLDVRVDAFKAIGR